VLLVASLRESVNVCPTVAVTVTVTVALAVAVIKAVAVSVAVAVAVAVAVKMGLVITTPMIIMMMAVFLPQLTYLRELREGELKLVLVGRVVRGNFARD
jgi:hypothetical protein